MSAPAECTGEARQSTCKMCHGQLHNGWADDALKSRAMFLCFAERLARAEESTSALRFIGSQRRTGCEQYESVLSRTICAAPTHTARKMRESLSGSRNRSEAVRPVRLLQNAKDASLALQGDAFSPNRISLPSQPTTDTKENNLNRIEHTLYTCFSCFTGTNHR